jgi:hypothetical protein
LESELTKAQDEKSKDAEDHKLQEEQRTQEYERFKHEKELEISSLKGTKAPALQVILLRKFYAYSRLCFFDMVKCILNSRT